MLWLVLGATALSIQMTGTYRHYWLQVFPICAVFCAFGIGWMLPKPGFRWIGGLLPVTALGAATMQTLPSSIAIIASPDFLSKRHTIKKAADAVAADIQPGDTLFALGHNLIYWYLDRMPITRIIHPNDLVQRFMTEPLAAHGYVDRDEMGRILALRPTYIVTHLQHGDPVPPYLRFGAYPILIRDYLADHYRLFYDDRSLSPPGWPTWIYKLRDERDIGGAGGLEDPCGRNGPGPERPCDSRELGL